MTARVSSFQPNRRQVLVGSTCAATLLSQPLHCYAAARPLNVSDFGAKGDGQADDTAAIQAAIDHALKARIAALHIPSGRYRTTDTLHLGYGETFTTLALVGEDAPAYAGATAGTLLLPERTDRPAVNFQGVRMGAIRFIAIRGANQDFIEAKTAQRSGCTDPDPQGWLDPKIKGGLAQFRPYAAITVDAYAAAPSPEGYPPSPEPPWPVPGGVPAARAFSSDVHIDRCWIGGFAVGVAVQPCDGDGNGDFVKLTGTTFHNCVYAIAIGNTQSRNVAIRDCVYGRLHTFVTNRHFGRGRGSLGSHIDNVSGGNSYQLLDVHAASSMAVTVTSLYFEAQARIGVWSNNSGFNTTLTFQGSTFDMNEPLIGHSAAALVECGSHGAVRFIGCTFHHARRIFNPVEGADHVGLDGCMLGHVHEHRDPGFYERIPVYFARMLNYTCGGFFHNAEVATGRVSLTGGALGLSFDEAGRAAETRSRGSIVVVSPGRREVVHHYAQEVVDRFGRGWQIKARPRPLLLAKVPGRGPLRELSHDGGDRLRIVLAWPAQVAPLVRFAPGDVLFDAPTSTVLTLSEVARDKDNWVLSALQLNNLREADKALRTTVQVDAPQGYIWHWRADVMVGDAVYWGDFTAGSAVVRNLDCGAGATLLGKVLQPGDMLMFVPSGPPLPGARSPQPYAAGTTIVAVDEARAEVTLDRPATASARFQVSTVVLA